MGFPHSSVGKKSACNEGDPSLIPGSGISAGEGIAYPLQHSWASLVAQLVKNLLAMWETWVQSLGWEDSPGEGKGYPLQYCGLENSMDCIVHGVTHFYIKCLRGVESVQRKIQSYPKMFITFVLKHSCCHFQVFHL